MGECAHYVPPPHTAKAASQTKALHAVERDTPQVQQARTTYGQKSAALDVRRLKFIDASGVNLPMTRLYGRASKGERVSGSLPQNCGQNVTMLAASGHHDLQAIMTVEARRMRRCCVPM